MPIDIIRFKKEAEESKDELNHFLENWNEDSEQIAKEIVAVADAEVWKNIGCLSCANCCKTMSPIYTEEDILRIATHLKISPLDYQRNYLLQYNNGDWANLSIPCHFLQPDNKCFIYEIRPECCAGFPHHNLVPIENLKTKLKANLNHCPATNELVRRLRAERD